MRRAFTLIELVVAVGILAIILSFAGVVFRVSAESQRMANANAEIMQKLRVITSQLDADFKGLIIDYGGHSTTSTRTQMIDGRTVTTNFDGFAFFANGDFQSTHHYASQMIVGNVASIYYGPPDPNSYSGASVPLPAPRDRILLRRQTILAPEAPEADSQWNGEYYRASLEQWRTDPPCTLEEWSEAPIIDPTDLEAQMPIYLAKGVDNFTVEYIETGTVLGTDAIPWLRQESGDSLSPLAFKVTFTLYDSRGIIEKGRTFTHIVLVDG
jgi:prepilin-type N-terminal cleavage/methylation domain-containing protein